MESEGMTLEEAHAEKQLAHSDLTHEDFLRMKDDGCPVCKAQQKPVDEVTQ